MDPVSRRQVWDLIEKVKHGRCIILTTHSMEEADILGDRIAIMRKGKLSTVGSSITLKNKFGNGFRLSVSTTDDLSSNDQIKLIVQKHLGVPRYTKDVKGLLTTEIVRSNIPALPNLVKELEHEGKLVGVENVELRISTLQDVFLKIAGEDEGADDDDIPAGAPPAWTPPLSPPNGAAGTAPTTPTTDKIRVNSVVPEASNTAAGGAGKEIELSTMNTTTAASVRNVTVAALPTYSFKNQLLALFKKSWLNQKRAKLTMCTQVIIPVLMIFILWGAKLAVDSISASRQSRSGASTTTVTYPILRPAQVQSTTLFVTDPYVSINCNQITSSYRASGIQPQGIFDPNGALMLYTLTNTSQTSFLGAYGASTTASDVWSPVGPGTGLLGSITKTLADMIEQKGYVDPAKGQGAALCRQATYAAPLRFVSSPDVQALTDTLYNSAGKSQATGAYIFNYADPHSLDVTVLTNKTISRSQDYPILVNYLSSAMLRESSGNNKLQLKFTGVKTFPSYTWSAASLDIIAAAGPFLYVFIFQLLMPVVLGSIVYEKEHNLREVMKMMGLKQRVYWIVTYFYNYVLYCVVVFLVIVIAAILGFKIFTVNSGGIIVIFFLLWGHTLMAEAFFFSVFFTKTRTATIFGYIFVFATGILDITLINGYITADTPDLTMFFISWCPQFAFYRGISDLTTGATSGGLTWAMFSDTAVHLDDVLLYFFVEWIILTAAALYLEAVLPSPLGVKSHPLFPIHYLMGLCRKKELKDSAYVVENVFPEDEPADVKAERTRTYADKDSLLRIYNLKKVYKGENGNPDHTAVHNLSYSVDGGQCFGFLGPNGAGKSTTMNMLCGYFGPTAGTAMVMGYDIRKDMDAIHMLLGVCPQDNIIWPELTAREHLQFFGKLKGLNGAELNQAVETRLKEVDLFTVADKNAGAFSGGMKRRLCVAIALVGNPRVVILDEPSTGLDPKGQERPMESHSKC
jgi:ABC-type multidrug transport system ATPase subunit